MSNRTIKNGEIITDEGVKANIPGIFYDKKRYDISRVGRYKYNKKLSLANRIADKELAEDVTDEFGEILATKGTVLSHEKAWEIQNAGINAVSVVGLDGTSVKIIGNNTVDLAAYLKKDPKELGIKELVYRPALQKIWEGLETEEEKEQAVLDNVATLVSRQICEDDIIAIVNYNLNLPHGVGV